MYANQNTGTQLCPLRRESVLAARVVPLGAGRLHRLRLTSSALCDTTARQLLPASSALHVYSNGRGGSKNTVHPRCREFPNPVLRNSNAPAYGTMRSATHESDVSC